MAKPKTPVQHTTSDGVTFHLMDEVMYKENGKMIKDSYWLEGAGYDTNDDNVIANKRLRCLLPRGKETLDLALLNPDCLNLGTIEIIEGINYGS